MNYKKAGFKLLPGVMGWNPLHDTSTNTKKLDAVVVKDYHSKITHRADFSYSYFNEDEYNSDINTAEKQQYIRLKLDGINVSGKNYRFEYISPNTLPRWPLAQPFRFLAHNGEINTIEEYPL